jgi:hypothetical protein
MKIETFSFSVDDYSAELTNQTHSTLYWLNRHGYLTGEDTDELLSRMIVTPVRNRPHWGKRILSRFFLNETDNENSYVFPIALLDKVEETDPPQRGKPILEVIK